MIVMKFGGTSVGTPANMKQVVQLVDNKEPKIVVLSALSGTTNSLENLAKHLYNKDLNAFVSDLSKLSLHYKKFVEELFTTTGFVQKANELVEAHLNHIKTFSKDMFTVYEERAILAQGELLSTSLFTMYCQEIGVQCVLLPALDFMRTNAKLEPDEYFIQVNLDRILKEQSESHLFVTQGYICRNEYGEIDNLKRGGSDFTASLIGAAINASEIQIWTDIDGMHNNDPRFVDRTKPIKNLSFDEAAELAYFGAKILHPSSVRPAQDKNIPVRLKNTMKPDAYGTLISNESNADSIKAVAAKDGITAIKIKSGRMLMAYGFLRSVFEVFEWYKTPIDMITTSEVAISLTIDNDENLSKIVADLEKLGSVEVDSNLTIVCVVGDFINEKSGFASEITSALRTVPLRMISYGGSKNNVSMLIKNEFKQEALEVLNSELFTW